MRHILMWLLVIIVKQSCFIQISSEKSEVIDNFFLNPPINNKKVHEEEKNRKREICWTIALEYSSFPVNTLNIPPHVPIVTMCSSLQEHHAGTERNSIDPEWCN